MAVSFRHSAAFGKRIEYYIVGLMLKQGLDVYLPMVDDDAIDPSTERGISTKAPQFTIDLEEDLLREVKGLLALTQQAERKVENHVLITTYNEIESRVVFAQTTIDKRCFFNTELWFFLLNQLESEQFLDPQRCCRLFHGGFVWSAHDAEPVCLPLG